MKRALYVPCHVGELGWELINYAPHVNHKCHKNSYDEVHVVVRKGREAIYPMGTHFYPIELSTKNAMGNSGPKPPNDDIVKRLQKKKFDVDAIKPVSRGCRYSKKRKFFKYEASQELLDKWNVIPNNAVTFCIRGRKTGPHKNWPVKRWIKFCNKVLELGFTPVITGVKETVTFNPPTGCIDLMGKTKMGDLMAVMQKSKFVTGQSTGPAHFASLCGVPHAIWGSARIQNRYISDWNPHGTIVEYHSCGSQFECSAKDAVELVNRMIFRLKNTECV